MSDLDLVVVGGGPAGISAAIWAHTLHLRYAVLDAGATPGGQLHRVYNTIVDYPGVEPGDGAALAGRFAAHLARLGVAVRSGSRVAASTRRICCWPPACGGAGSAFPARPSSSAAA